MRTAVTKYHCPVCDLAYDTPGEALACYRSPRGRFTVGDIIEAGGRIYRITYLDEVGSAAIDGAGVEPVLEYIAARDFSPSDSGSPGYLVGGAWCTAKLTTVSYAAKVLADLTKRQKAAVKFLEQVQASHSRQQATG